MIVGKAIYYLLTNATDVTDVVSTRIYPEIAQQDAALPYIVYNVANNEPTDTKPEPSKLDTAQVEVNIYSDSYTEAIDLAVAVRAALDRVKGTYSGVNVQSIQYLNEVIDFDEPQRAYNISSDYDVRISRTDFEIAQGSPITGVELGELSDVNVSGATDNQVLSYDAATDTWVAADDAGGAEVLNDLADVDAGQPEAGQLLAYGQGDWTTIDQDQLEVPINSVTGLQAALDATPDALEDLDDVKIVGTPSEGDALVYQSGFWSRGTAGASTLGELDDVNTAGAGVGSTITFNGSTWEISGSELPADDIYYHNRYATEAETLRSGATATVELYYTAQADGDGYAESAESDTATTGFDIRRKLYYSEAAQADCDTGTWVQFADIADDTTFASAKATLLAYLKARTGGTVPISLKMTWEEVSEASYLLDTYTGAAAAYSLRQIKSTATNAVRVRRASDNAEQDIGFSAGELDTTSLASFCSGTDGFVVTWYDQSGSGNDATQGATGSQPKIYDGTTGVVTEGTKPAINLDSNDFFDLGSLSAASGDDVSYYWVGDWLGETSNNNRFVLHASETAALYIGLIGQNASALSGTLGLSSVTGYKDGVSVAVATRNNVHDAFRNVYHLGELYGTTTTAFSDTQLGRYPAGDNHYLNGNLQEFIFYTSDQSSNRTNIEDDINTFYSIY